MASGTLPLFPSIDKCSSINRQTHTVVADLDGALLRTRSLFPYFALLAFDAGGVLRLLFLLVLSPLAAILHIFVSESAGIRVLIFASVAGVKLSSIESAAKAVLPKFYVEDLRSDAWRVIAACGRRCVLTACPRVMVEVFLKNYLGADMVAGTELVDYMGRATGFVRWPGVLVGEKKAAAVKSLLGDRVPEIGIGGKRTDFFFLSLCKEAYVVPPLSEMKAVQPSNVPKPKPVFFHDGRLVQKPTPLLALCIILWFPIGILLAGIRISAAYILPMKYVYFAFRALGIRIIVEGIPPPPTGVSGQQSSNLFVCSHRTLLDPVFLSVALRRPVTAVTYSLSRLSELISPINTIRLTRHRTNDAAIINNSLQKGDLVVCPEGTTCREPFLLRFSALFAELSDEIVPVGTVSRQSMFHCTTARGWKGMDSIYFFMNPRPTYKLTFLDKLPAEMTCGGGGKSSHEVANYIQKMIAATLSYQCTSFTRKDKYMALAGNDGVVGMRASRPPCDKDLGC